MDWSKHQPTLAHDDIVMVRMKYNTATNWVVTAARVDREFFYNRDEPCLHICGCEEGDRASEIDAGFYAFEWGPVVYSEIQEKKKNE